MLPLKSRTSNKPSTSQKEVLCIQTPLASISLMGRSPIHSSSSIFSDLIGVWSSLSSEDPVPAVVFSFMPVPSTPSIRPEDSAIRRRRAFSSAADTLARCFFSGLPRKPSTVSTLGWDFSGVSVSVAIFGGVIERSAGGVVPEAAVLPKLSVLLEPGSAECCRLSYEIVSTSLY